LVLFFAAFRMAAEITREPLLLDRKFINSPNNIQMYFLEDKSIELCIRARKKRGKCAAVLNYDGPVIRRVFSHGFYKTERIS